MIFDTLDCCLPAVSDFLAERKRAVHYDLAALRTVDLKLLRPVWQVIDSLTGTWNPLEFVTAGNYLKQREQFLSAWRINARANNPQFTYPGVAKIEVAPVQETLKELKTQTLDLAREIQTHRTTTDQQLQHLLALLTLNKINDDLATCDLILGLQSRSDALVMAAADRKYGPLDPSVYKLALKIYRLERKGQAKVCRTRPKPKLTPTQQAWLERQEFSAEQIAAAFSWALKRYGLLARAPGEEGYLVRVSSEASSIAVRDRSQSGYPTVVIPADRRVNGKKLLRLIGHEIEAHARQSSNGARLFGLGGGKLKIDATSLAEGLAKQADTNLERTYFGTCTPTPNPYYVLAMVLARSGKTFKDVFKRVLQLRRAAHPEAEIEVLQAQTWQTTYRIFRGSSDPDNKIGYAFPKDKAYLEGYLLAQQLAEQGYDQYNQLAITSGSNLRILGKFDLKPGDIPYPYLNLQQEFWQEKLLPMMQQSITG